MKSKSSFRKGWVFAAQPKVAIPPKAQLLNNNKGDISITGMVIAPTGAV
ncbi:MAG: hypothetical protein LC102_01480 [Ignavibacteriales bacterium]|jgi:hypothetical protein|nr:hypothetical protein [Ignavibacteria bacterium]MCZ2142084.1 hypothetical protein [Ignavibacteriales bacterium]WKZ71717.1 MAG: hypothetical protein QY308_08815 [Ignavibacteriaceae bacterium]